MGVGWWTLVVVAGACLPGGLAESFLTSIGNNLRSQMLGVLEMAAVNYSQPALRNNYSATVEFDMRAMGMIYNNTHLVIDAISQKQAYPEGILTVSDGHVELPPEGMDAHWKRLLAHYAGPIAALSVALLVAALLPPFGLMWCCCYWCRSGRRRRPFDRKYDGCLKALLAILLIALLTLLLFGVVCAFATDAQAEEGLSRAGRAVRAGQADARTFLNNTQAHARHLLVTNYKELEKKLTAILTSSGLTISGQLGEFSRAVSVTTLTGMVRQLGPVQRQLRDVQRLTTQLRANADSLNAALRAVKKMLLDTLSRCEQPQCVQLQEKHKIGQLDTEIHYSQMPDVSELLRNVTLLLDSDIQADVEQGQQVFVGIKREVQRSVDEHIPGVEEEITSMGQQLERVSAQISAMAGNASAWLGAADVGGRLDGLHARYGPYRRAAGLGAAALLLAEVVLLSWGLVCGVCGKRPDAYGASDCCNKGAGSKCLICGMVAMFIVVSVGALVAAAHFAAGLAATRVVCDPLTEPRGNRLFADVEKFIDIEHYMYNEHSDPGFNLTYIITACHANHTLYTALQLHRRADVSSARAARARLAERATWPRPRAAWPAVAILSPAARRKLAALADSGLSDFDFDRILHALETNMTSMALDGLSSQLSAAAAQLSARPGFADVAAELRRAADKLQRADTDVLAPMLRDTHQLNATATELRDRLRFNHSSLKEAISYLLDETSQAEHFLNTQGPDLVQNMTQQFAQVVVSLVEQYLDMVEESLSARVGRCGPLSRAFNNTRDAHCHNILMPVNGYWLSLAWCMILFAPLYAVAERLARLYRNLDPYPGPLVEAEYLYDAYADRDNVPLANAYKADKRGGGSRGAGAGGGGGAGGGAAGSAPAPRLDAHHARRYNDMAPKHWEEGPPRYHGPTEYERPPPYYYPGPTDRQ